MRVAIAGGAGKIGRRLIVALVEAGDEVRSLDRNPDHAESVRSAGAEPVVCDLERAGLPEIAAAIDGVSDGPASETLTTRAPWSTVQRIAAAIASGG